MNLRAAWGSLVAGSCLVFLSIFLAFLAPIILTLSVVGVGIVLAYRGYRRRESLEPHVRQLKEDIANKEKGRAAEDDVASKFRALPDQFHVIHDLLLGNGMGNVDHVLFGSRGVIAVETKNLSGSFEIDRDEWHKVAREDGTPMAFPLSRSPSQQVADAAERLEGMLRLAGIEIAVHPVVVLADPDCKVDIRREGVPIWRFESLVDSLRRLPVETDLLSVGRAAQMLYERHQRVGLAPWPQEN